MERIAQVISKISFILILLQIFPRSLKAEEPGWTAHTGARGVVFRKVIYRAKDFGVVPDSVTPCTKAIQRAIDVCARQGGGTVVFDHGTYLTGSLFVRKGVNLRIDKGVELRGSSRLEDYPEIETRIAGIEMRWPAALINIVDQKNVAITGDGVINAQGKPFWDAYWSLRKEYEPKGLRWIVDYDARRPRTLLISGSSDVIVKKLTLRQAGFWTVHVLYSSHITIDGIVIQNNVGGHGPSTDGIDIDSSNWILVKNCDIDCNDDNFCIKSGRDWDGLRVNKPAEYIFIRDCFSRKGGGLITFGSETSGGMRHIMAKNLKAQGTTVGIRFKSARNRGGVVEDIYLENIEMDGVGTAIEITPNWNPSYSYSTLPPEYKNRAIPEHWKKMLHPVTPPSKGIPEFKDVFIRDLRATNVKKAIFVEGLEEKPVNNFQLKHVEIEAKSPGSVKNATNWIVEDTRISTPGGESVSLVNSPNVKFDQ